MRDLRERGGPRGAAIGRVAPMVAALVGLLGCGGSKPLMGNSGMGGHVGGGTGGRAAGGPSGGGGDGVGTGAAGGAVGSETLSGNDDDATCP